MEFVDSVMDDEDPNVVVPPGYSSARRIDRRWTHAYSRQGRLSTLQNGRLKQASFLYRDRAYHSSYRKRKFYDNDEKSFPLEERMATSRSALSYQIDSDHRRNSRNLHSWDTREVLDQRNQAKDNTSQLESARFYGNDGCWKNSLSHKSGYEDSKSCIIINRDYDDISGYYYQLSTNKKRPETSSCKEEHRELPHDGFIASRGFCNGSKDNSFNSLLSFSNFSQPGNFKSRTMCLSDTGYCNKDMSNIGRSINERKSTNTCFFEPSSAICCDAEDESLPKKPRLGWGEGLAKYENKSTEVFISQREENGLLQFGNHSIQPTVSVSLPTLEAKTLDTEQEKHQRNNKSLSLPTDTPLLDKNTHLPGGRPYDVSSHDTLLSGVQEDIRSTGCKNMSCGDCYIRSENTSMAYLPQISNAAELPSFNSQSVYDKPPILVKSMMDGIFEGDFPSTEAMHLAKTELLQKLEGVEMELDCVEKEIVKLNVNTESKCLASEEKDYKRLSKVSSEVLNMKETVESHRQGQDDGAILYTAEGMHVKEEFQANTNDSFYDINHEFHNEQSTIPSELKNKGNTLFQRNSDTEPVKAASDSFKIILAGIATSSSSLCHSVISETQSWKQNNLIHEKLRKEMEKMILKQKQLQIFREKTLALKYRILRKWWKEERMMPVFNKDDRNSCANFSGTCQDDIPKCVKARSWARYLTFDMNVTCSRNFLKMPVMKFIDGEGKFSRYFTNNGLVENPIAVEEERKLINPWTQEEKNIFWEKFSIFKKSFARIASCLRHKTVADCVEFYYKYHKSEQPKKSDQRSNKKQQNCNSHGVSYLSLSGSRKRQLSGTSSLDVLGTVAAITIDHTQRNLTIQLLSKRACKAKPVGKCLKKMKNRNPASNGKVRNGVDFFRNWDAAVDLKNGIHNFSMGSCCPMNGVVDSPKVKTKSRLFITNDKPYKPLVSESTFDSIYSPQECSGDVNKDWTDNEKSLFIGAYSKHGRDFQSISSAVQSRTEDECRTFFCKARKPLKLDDIPKQEVPTETACNIHSPSKSIEIDREDALSNKEITCGGSTEPSKSAAADDCAENIDSNKVAISCNTPHFKFTQDEQSELDELWEACKRNLGLATSSEYHATGIALGEG